MTPSMASIPSTPTTTAATIVHRITLSLHAPPACEPDHDLDRAHDRAHDSHHDRDPDRDHAHIPDPDHAHDSDPACARDPARSYAL